MIMRWPFPRKAERRARREAKQQGATPKRATGTTLPLDTDQRR